jgi:hypothetical protein
MQTNIGPFLTANEEALLMISKSPYSQNFAAELQRYYPNLSIIPIHGGTRTKSSKWFDANGNRKVHPILGKPPVLPPPTDGSTDRPTVSGKTPRKKLPIQHPVGLATVGEENDENEESDVERKKDEEFQHEE